MAAEMNQREKSGFLSDSQGLLPLSPDELGYNY